MRVAVYGRNFSLDFKKYIEKFFDILKQYNVDVLIYQDFAEFLIKTIGIDVGGLKIFTKYTDLKDNVNLLFSIGGDGTILSAINYVRDNDIPVVGINTGRLGFLASIAKEDIESALAAILNSDYEIEERTLLKLETSSNVLGDFPYGLNEATVQKIDSGMITIHVYVNDEFLNTYWADGLIISTPTGSTAYSLSVGGPIVIPSSGNFIISPISPHNLTMRPIVLPDTSKLRLKLEGRALNYITSLDHRSIMIKNIEELYISKADFTIKIIKLQDTSFYKTLRNKLMWGVDTRN